VHSPGHALRPPTCRPASGIRYQPRLLGRAADGEAHLHPRARGAGHAQLALELPGEFRDQLQPEVRGVVHDHVHGKAGAVVLHHQHGPPVLGGERYAQHAVSPVGEGVLEGVGDQLVQQQAAGHGAVDSQADRLGVDVGLHHSGARAERGGDAVEADLRKQAECGDGLVSVAMIAERHQLGRTYLWRLWPDLYATIRDAYKARLKSLAWEEKCRKERIVREIVDEFIDRGTLPTQGVLTVALSRVRVSYADPVVQRMHRQLLAKWKEEMPIDNRPDGCPST